MVRRLTVDKSVLESFPLFVSEVNSSWEFSVNSGTNLTLNNFLDQCGWQSAYDKSFDFEAGIGNFSRFLVGYAHACRELLWGPG